MVIKVMTTMPEYMEHLPKDADLDLLFRDLHGKVDGLVVDLEDLAGIEHGEGSGQMPISGTEIEMSRTRLPREDDERVTTHVYTSLGGELRKLVAVSSILDDQEEGGPQPVQVEANRGGELISDYSIERLREGIIAVRLDDNRNVRPAEPIGIMSFGPTAKLRMFNDIDLMRTQTVMEGIRDNISIARLILDGASPIEAFEKVITAPISE
jgi:hypothetical protein